MNDSDIRFGTWERALLPPEKIFQSVKKFQTKNWRIHLDIIYVHVKFQRKLIFFMASIKRQKDVLRKALFNTEFVFSTRDT